MDNHIKEALFAMILSMADCRTCKRYDGKRCLSLVLCTDADQWKQINSLQMWKKSEQDEQLTKEK